ncbi:protein retinal degeneration B [Danaus plexippus]|uniref:Retinal degeneration B like protein n=2 Tax=Danaus plexippus TaxID=13037 RepID=A0A212FLT0_DANPL|nr:protein retinal degeneration B [Danaus plexippus]OWR54650.1 retinal degeneration B like protein [Danaus plexippus plexippus]QDQ16914.1 retinal degeneration B [Danaus plexippus]
MLIKEYRIPLPLTVEEYRIAQLYMIAKKSREESSGEGSGVEIIVNEPYDNGPGGNGQYTQKIYHVGSHLPGWFKSLLPKSALTVSEEAWNAYPYTKTRYTCPFVEKFSLEIETYYFADNGHQENVFKLSGSDLKNRAVDIIDVVKDQLYGADYVKEEDPKIFVSQKCNRGPLSESWLEDYWREVQGKTQPLPNGKSLMCAYKLCRVEFRYWGMQTKLEKFIHDVALRKTMLRAHRQAWAWQDEWHGLTMDDIREIERQTQLALQKKMAGDVGEDTDLSEENSKSLAATMSSLEKNEDTASPVSVKKGMEKRVQKQLSPESTPPSEPKSCSKSNLRSSSSGSLKSLQVQVASWRMETLVRESETETGSEDEFYDCESSFNKWSSMCSLDEGDIDISPTQGDLNQEDSIFNPTFLKRVTSERGSRRLTSLQSHQSIDGCPDTPVHSSCPTTVLILVFHAGSVLDANVDMTAKKSDVTTFKGAFESVMRQHYPTLVGHITIKLVSCPSLCTEALGVLSTLSPYSFDCSPSTVDSPSLTNDLIPIGAIPLIATSSPEYHEYVTKTITAANVVYNDFIKSDDGKGFNGQVCIVGDSMGSILAYDALCRTLQYQSRHDSENSILDTEITIRNEPSEHYLNKSHLQAPTPRRRSSTASDNQTKLEFEVSDFFTFGSPLSLILASRKISDDKFKDLTKPPVQQIYNLFHPTDPVASRLEPLLSARFSNLAPINVARYAKYPLGNGQPYHLMELIHTHPTLFGDHLPMPPTPVLRRLSEASVQSTVSGLVDNIPLITMNALQQKWWGTKRLDYALYCPEGLTNFPMNALPHLFHASYWESSDVIAFILRQVGHFDLALYGQQEDKDCSLFKPGQDKEKWMRKRTSVKLKNVAANHRANDVIVGEGCPQTFIARFMYGPLDMITLTGEKVDIHMIRDPPAGEWTLLSTVVTDKTGRITYTLTDKQSVGCGIYPVRAVVRGDHTSCNFHLAVIPPQTECVVFSIDGSFTASVSVTGRDPKVRAGAVDVVRFWQDLGYLILYITGRPDMQQRKVVSWLAEHNFPHGLVFFSDGFSTDPLGHKAAHLHSLITEHGVIFQAAYGSGKDINVYHNCGLPQKQIYAIGKISKKYNNLATTLNDGYASHLADLKQPGAVRPARGNARLLVPRRLLASVSNSSSRGRR